VRLFQEERLATFRVNMGMRAEEWSEDANLIPTDEHFRLWVSEEATNIGWRKKFNERFYREEALEHLHPAKGIPAILLDKTIWTPTAMCSQVPRLSPVHIAPNLWEPA
jgi:hypothetical protein